MKETGKYTPKYFRDNHPKKKNSKSSWLVRVFYRKVSFYFTTLAYKCGLTANMVSFIGLLMGFVAAGLFLIPNKTCNIFGGIICILWVISDCVDGNLARLVAKQPYGEFIDACGSYTIVAFLLPAVGMAAFRDGNSILLINDPWIIFFGALGGLSDCMARLYFQKYKNEKMIIEGHIESISILEESEDQVNKLYQIYTRLSKEIGLTGLFIPFLIAATIMGWLDLFVIFYFLFYFANYMATLILLVKITGCLKKTE